MNDPGLVSVVIADDEPLARERLRSLLGLEPEFRLVGEAVNGTEAVRLLQEHRPDIAILDIRLPGLDAFGILRALGDQAHPAVILVTAHSDRAAEAFQAGAVDYLLKPFDARRLQAALQRAKSGRVRAAGTQPTLPSSAAGRIALRSAGRWVLMDADSIEAVLSANIHCEVISRDGASLRVSEALGSLGNRLPEDRFLRVSRFAIVNLSAIGSMAPRSHGDQTLELQSGRTLIATRSHREELLRRLKNLR